MDSCIAPLVSMKSRLVEFLASVLADGGDDCQRETCETMEA
jgi:hypothetical protein